MRNSYRRSPTVAGAVESQLWFNGGRLVVVPQAYASVQVRVCTLFTQADQAPQFQLSVQATTLFVVTVIAPEVVEFPAASRAIARSVCEPLGVLAEFQDIENGELVSSAPIFTPSRVNCTPNTPTLSVAVAVMLTVPDTVAAFAGAVILTTGAVESQLCDTAG